MGDGDGVDFRPVVLTVFGFKFGVREGLVDDGEDGFEVVSGCNFGDDAAVGLKDVDLGDDDVREEFIVF